MTDTPRTEAGRLADWMMDHLVEYNRWMTTGWRDTMRDEAVVLAGQMLEAAAGPRDAHAVIVDRWPHTAAPCYGQCHDAVQKAVGRWAAAGPRDCALRVRTPDGGWTRGCEAAAGPSEVPTLPPPDLSLIDTLGEGADPDRPVRVEAPAGPRDDGGPYNGAMLRGNIEAATGPRDEGLREAAQRLVDVIFAEAQAEPFVLPLRGMRAANDLRAALEETA